MGILPKADRIEQVAFGFMASKVLFCAIEFGVFTELAKGPLRAEEIQARLKLHRRSAHDFLDTLVAFGMLERNGEWYSNTSEPDFYLDRNKPTYIGGFFQFWNVREYPVFGSLGEGLATGKTPKRDQNRDRKIEALYATPERLRVRGMTGHSLPSAMAIARKFPWSKYKSFVDIGPAEGCLAVQVALANRHLTGEGFDLPTVGPVFEEYVASFGLRDRIRFRAGNFFTDQLPTADALVMGMILHDWNLETKRQLLTKAFDALPKGGALIVYEHLIDDERRRMLLVC
jgi:O-methyltransferase domain/Dimerisation domain